MSKDLKLKLTINADGNVRGVVRDINSDLKRFKDQTSQATSQTDQLGSSLQRISQYAVAAFGGWQLARYTQNIVQSADAYASMTGQLKLVTESSAELAYVQGELNRIAFDTRGDIMSMTKLYSSLAPTFKEMGKSTAESAHLVELYNKSLALTSPTAGESAAATLQFAQAMGSGILRGEEFNSIMENGRGVAMMLAEGLGVPIGALRAMAEQGQLTADVVVAALEQQADTIEAKFTQIPLVVSGGWKNVRTEAMLYIGELDQSMGATQVYAETLNTLAQNMDSVALTLGGTLLLATSAAGGKLTQLTLAKIADIRATTAAHAAEKARLASTVQMAERQKYLALQELQLARARASLAVGTSQITAAEAARMNAMHQAAARTRELGIATANYNQYARSSGLLVTGLRGAMSLLGGPVGIGLAIAGFTSYALMAKQAEASTQSVIDKVQSLTGSYQQLQRAQLSQALTEVNAEIEKLRVKVFTNQDKSLWDVLFGDPEQARAENEKNYKAFQTLLKSREELKTKLAEPIKAPVVDTTEANASIEQTGLIYENVMRSIYEADMREFDRLDAIDDENEDLAKRVNDFTLSVDRFGDAWTRTGNKALDALNSMRTVLDEVTAAQARNSQDQIALDQLRFENAQRLAKQKMSMSDYLKNEAALTEAQNKLDKKRTADSIKGTRAMLDASVAMYEDGSDTQKAAHAASLTMHAIELAMAMEKAIANATVAVSNQGQGDPYTAFARVGAMAVMMGGVLSQIGATFDLGVGSVSAGYSHVPLAKDGGTLSGEASNSLANISDLLVDINADQYVELRKINAGIQAINDALRGTVRTLYAAGDISNLSANPTAEITGIGQSFREGFGNSLVGGLVGGVLGWAGDGIFGSTKKTSTDYGLTIDGNLGALDVSGYETIKTKRSNWFSSSTSYKDHERDISAQTATMVNGVFSDLGDAMVEVGDALDMNVRTAVDDFDIEIGKISLNGTAEEIEQRFEEAINAESDRLANELFGDLTRQYQKLNEGMFETLTRLAIEKTVAEDILAMTGQSVGTQMQKTLSWEKTGKGWFGWSLVSTFEEVEADAIAVTQSLVELAGGLEALQEAAASYYDKFYSEEEKAARNQAQLIAGLEAQNLALPETRQGYRDLVESLNLGNEAAREQYVTLLELSDLADEYYSNLEQKAQETANLQQQESEAYKNQLLADRIDLLKDESLAIKTSLNELQKLYGGLEDTHKAIMGSITASAVEYASAQSVLANSLTQARAGQLPTYDSLSDALSVLARNSEGNYASYADYRHDQIATAAMIDELMGYTSDQMSVEEQALAALEDGLDYLQEIAHNTADYSKVEVEQIVADIPGFASGGIHRGGLRLVGENGPELEWTGASHITDAGTTSRLLDNSAMLRALESMHAELVRLRSEQKSGLISLAKNTKYTAQTLQQWQYNGQPPLRDTL